MSNKKKVDWRNFFDSHEDEHVQTISYGGIETSASMEELYEAFKQRLLSEINFGSILKKEKP